LRSKLLGVGAMVLRGRAGAGMVATQAWANVAYGPRGLGLLEAGATAGQALEVLLGADDQPDQRQAAIVDARGQQSAALLVVRKGGGYGGRSDRHRRRGGVVGRAGGLGRAGEPRGTAGQARLDRPDDLERPARG
jgi:uncharacterized Ntn-hydrolase superfamily protein